MCVRLNLFVPSLSEGKLPLSGAVTRVWQDSSPHKFPIDNRARTGDAINDEMCKRANEWWNCSGREYCDNFEEIER
jgi:hypothetical protein